MRQAGFKPKGHNSGTYWVRANAETGGGKSRHKMGEPETLQDTLDDFTSERTSLWVKISAYVIGLGIAIFLIVIGIQN